MIKKEKSKTDFSFLFLIGFYNVILSYAFYGTGLLCHFTFSLLTLLNIIAL